MLVVMEVNSCSCLIGIDVFLFTPDFWMHIFCNFGEWMGGISLPMLVLQENLSNAHLQYVANDVAYVGNAHAQGTFIGWQSPQF